jgi:wyosine [tRNA(Phe)-imidazoG37] synthetase (radical SAM superfamily)
MASYSEVKKDLDEVAGIIREQKAVALKIITNAQNGSDILDDVPTRFAATIEAINAYGTQNAAEALAKAELAKMTAEFTALKNILDQIAAIQLP